MSAIAGILRLDGGPAHARDLELMVDALAAHGPDRRSITTLGAVGLAHLLMRITPEDVFDNQPLRGPSGAVITADLRLDNRDDVAAELGFERDRAATSSDAALALAAWERWGDDAWPRLRGPFAVAIWNPAERVLTLARDPLGLGVVTWNRSAAFFAFATLPKGVLALPDVPRALNEEKFADFVVANHAEHETTFYREIFRLPPAHVARIDSTGRMTSLPYWSDTDIKPVRLGSDQDYADATHEHLDRAVRRQLRSIHPVGCFLSGGLDSSSVAVLAARALGQQGKRLAAYTQVPRAGFELPPDAHDDADETSRVETLRQALGNLDVTYVRTPDGDETADLESVFQAMDGPPRNPTNLGWYLEIIRLARSHDRRVLLGGDFGNFTVSWDGWPQALSNLMHGRFVTAFRQWRLLYRISARSRLSAFRFLFLEPLALDARTLSKRIRGIGLWTEYAALRPDFAAEMRVEQRARRMEHDFLGRLPLDTLRLRLQYLRGADYRGDLHAGMLALHGIDLRDPTSDLDVVSFCLGIPDAQYLVEDIDRSLIRRAMWGIMPAAILTNRARGLQAADWFEKISARRDAMLEELSGLRRLPSARRALDIDRLERALRNWPTGGWHKRRVVLEYQLALTRGLASGQFLRWFEQNK